MSGLEKLDPIPERVSDGRAPPSPIDAWMESRPRIGEETLSTGRTVYFLSMNGAEHHKLVVHNAMYPNNPMPDAEIVAMCACDQLGNKLFADVSHGIGMLQGRDSCDLRKIAVAIIKHSRLPTTPEEVEALEKKS